MATRELRIRIPRLTGEAANNLLGVAGLLAIVAAVGVLAGWPWGLLAAGLFAVGVHLAGATYYASAPVPSEEPVVTPLAAVAAVTKPA